jgi:hypothetical protein
MGDHYPTTRHTPFEPEEARARLAFFGLVESDELNLALIRGVLQEDSSAIIDRFYEHLSAFPECRTILASETRVLRLKDAQRAYLSTLGDFRLADPASVLRYFDGRMRVGVAHERLFRLSGGSRLAGRAGHEGVAG